MRPTEPERRGARREEGDRTTVRGEAEVSPRLPGGSPGSEKTRTDVIITKNIATRNISSASRQNLEKQKQTIRNKRVH